MHCIDLHARPTVNKRCLSESSILSDCFLAHQRTRWGSRFWNNISCLNNWWTDCSIHRPLSSSSVCTWEAESNRIKGVHSCKFRWLSTGFWNLHGKEHLHSSPTDGNRWKCSPAFDWDTSQRITGLLWLVFYHHQSSGCSSRKGPACYRNNSTQSNPKRVPLHCWQHPEQKTKRVIRNYCTETWWNSSHQVGGQQACCPGIDCPWNWAPKYLFQMVKERKEANPSPNTCSGCRI